MLWRSFGLRQLDQNVTPRRAQPVGRLGPDLRRALWPAASPPHKQAGHMTAPDQCCSSVRKFLPRRRPHMTQSGHDLLRRKSPLLTQSGHGAPAGTYVKLSSVKHTEGDVRPRGTASGPVVKGHRAFRPKARKAQRSKASTPGLQELVAALTRELQEAREQQTATSEVLQIISSSSGELEPVFQAMLANATRLCGAEFAILFRVDDGVALPLARFGVPAPIMELIVKRGAIRPNENAPIM